MVAGTGGRATSTQKRKGREYKEVSRLAEKKHPDEEQRREGVFLCVLIGFTSSLTAAVLGEAPSPPAPAGAGSARDAICWEISWRYQSERCQGLLWGRSPTTG